MIGCVTAGTSACYFALRVHALTNVHLGSDCSPAGHDCELLRLREISVIELLESHGWDDPANSFGVPVVARNSWAGRFNATDVMQRCADVVDLPPKICLLQVEVV